MLCVISSALPALSRPAIRASSFVCILLPRQTRRSLAGRHIRAEGAGTRGISSFSAQLPFGLKKVAQPANPSDSPSILMRRSRTLTNLPRMWDGQATSDQSSFSPSPSWGLSWPSCMILLTSFSVALRGWPLTHEASQTVNAPDASRSLQTDSQCGGTKVGDWVVRMQEKYTVHRMTKK